MKPYSQFAPTGFDRKGAFLDDDRQHWLVCPVSRNRDSKPIEESNFEAFLNGLGGESDTVEVHRFGHWGPGWFEIIIIDPKAEDIVSRAEEMEGALENYPVLDEDDLSKREYEAYREAWDSWGRNDFLRAMQHEFSNQFIGSTPHGYSLDEIDDGFDLLADDDVDALFHNAVSKCGWEYQMSSDGVSVNIDDAIERLNLDEVADKVDAALWDRDTKRDISRLCRAVGMPSEVEQAAVEKKITMLSGIRMLARQLARC